MKNILVMLGALLIVTASCFIFAAGPTFTPKQLSDLKATGRDIIVPTYLPDGFQVKKILVDRTPPEVPSYAILFSGPGDACFVIEMGTEVGDIIVDNDKGTLVKPSSVIHNPTLGNVEFWNTHEYLGTGWFPSHKNAAYMLKGDIDRSEFHRDLTAATCKRPNATELLNIAKSLDVLKR